MNRHPCLSRRALLLALGLLLPACRGEKSAPAAEPIRVVAAASLSDAFAELGPRFERETGERLSFSFASSGLATRQLKEGAPFDLFVAANVPLVDQAIAAGVCEATSKAIYARGRLTLWTRAGSGLKPPEQLAQLADPRFVRLAIANPEHAPYGTAAREALVSAGVWEKLQPRVVFGENVQQALQFAQTGNVEVAFASLAQVIGKKDGAWKLVDEHLHRPLDQALVACRGGKRFDGGLSLGAFINSPAGREVMRRYGFVLPGESVAEAP